MSGFPDTARLRRDVEALTAMERRSAGEGERQAAQWAAVRLEQAGAVDVRVEPFDYHHTWAYGQVPYDLAGLAGVALGGPLGAGLVAAALAAYDNDYLGRSQIGRALLPTSEGANALARVPARGERRRTLVLVAHSDAAHTGIMWRDDAAAPLAARTGRHPSFAAPLALGYGLALAGAATRNRWLRGAGAGLLATGIAVSLQCAASATVPGANDNASGVAALLALVERFAAEPLEGVEVVACVPGCEESGMGGMAAFLRGAALDPATTLVLCFDSLGSGQPIVLDAEAGPVTKVRYRREDVELAERGARRAGHGELRHFQLGGWTDAALAVHRGIPTISLLSLEPGGGRITNYHVPTDTADRVDYECVAECARIGAGIAEEFAGAV